MRKVRVHTCKCKNRPHTIIIEQENGYKYNKCPICRGMIKGSDERTQKVTKIVVKMLVASMLFLSHIMCMEVAYNYHKMICGINHEGYSAPLYTVIFPAIPYIMGILTCIILLLFLGRKLRHNT